MPDDATKATVRSGTGHLFFPREWEGLHDAFPEFPPQLDSRNPFLPHMNNLAYGAAGGIIWNSIRALRGKPLTHAVLNGVGLVTIPLTLLSVAAEEIGRRSALPDIKAILKADNITLPRRRYIKQVKGQTQDEWAVSAA
jgi:hypothetical protein